MKLTQQGIIDLHRKYAKNDEYFERIYTHCLIVRDIALWCAEQCSEPVDTRLLEDACLVHDVGSSGFMGEGFDYSYYQQHALLGAALLEGEGVDPRIVEMVKNHIHVATSADDVAGNKLRLPAVDYSPTTIEGQILNYADRYHSKDPKFVSLASNIAKYEQHMPSQVALFKQLARRFGVPDLAALSQKYGHPIT